MSLVDKVADLEVMDKVAWRMPMDVYEGIVVGFDGDYALVVDVPGQPPTRVEKTRLSLVEPHTRLKRHSG